MSAITTRELVEIDERRLLRRLDDLAQRGALPQGGIYRPLYSPQWTSAMELVATWMKDAGLLVRRDPVGNMWGRIEGSRGGRVIATGSHIDTVRGGGALDGALGVVAGIEAVSSLWQRFGRSTRILECVVICEEEGSRFNTNFWGARAIADRLEPGEADRVRDADGVSLGDAMRGVGLDPAAAATAVRRDLDVFVELHVEQGPILEDHGPRLGVVTTIAGERNLGVEIKTLRDRPPVNLSPRVGDVLRRAAVTAGIEPREMTSGAGHDAQVLTAAANAGMLFVPSIGGRSHCPEEATAAEDVVLGTRVLATALRELAYQT